MNTILCDYTNHSGERVSAVTDEYYEKLYLVNYDSGTVELLNEVWCIDILLDDIDFKEDVVMKGWFHENLLDYLKTFDGCEEIEKEFTKADIILK